MLRALRIKISVPIGAFFSMFSQVFRNLYATGPYFMKLPAAPFKIIHQCPYMIPGNGVSLIKQPFYALENGRNVLDSFVIVYQSACSGGFFFTWNTVTIFSDANGSFQIIHFCQHFNDIIDRFWVMFIFTEKTKKITAIGCQTVVCAPAPIPRWCCSS